MSVWLDWLLSAQMQAELSHKNQKHFLLWLRPSLQACYTIFKKQGEAHS